MEEHLSSSERKNMDTCLKRLKQELLSMKEAGDGLHTQMNSMMGALQELKLLQVQTALEQLDISGRYARAPLAAESRVSRPTTEEHRPPWITAPTSQEGQRRAHHRSSLDTSPSSSSLESGSFPDPNRVSRNSTLLEDCSGQCVNHPPAVQQNAQIANLPWILHSLSREGPSLDADYDQDGADDSSDWTSSLMNRSRNRQPLVLGDNVFADLVGNWLDLPELEQRSTDEEEEEDPLGRPLQLSRSQEICRKFSLTTNIFKKFLRSVRPDRDKLLKEKPGWLPLDEPEAELFKRPKKGAKPKGTFYLPFRAAGLQVKGRPWRRPAEEKGQIPGININRGQSNILEKVPPVFDYNTAVWV